MEDLPEFEIHRDFDRVGVIWASRMPNSLNRLVDERLSAEFVGHKVSERLIDALESRLKSILWRLVNAGELYRAPRPLSPRQEVVDMGLVEFLSGLLVAAVEEAERHRDPCPWTMPGKGNYVCAWCGAEQPSDQDYQAWDWMVCRSCFQELEEDCYGL